MSFVAFRVLLAAPCGSILGGIAQQTNALLEKWKTHKEVAIDVVNTAPTWRGVLNRHLAIRVVGGAIHAALIAREFKRKLRVGRPSCVYVRSSANMGIVRDYYLLRLARRSRIRSCLSLHTGMIPHLIETRHPFFRVLKRTCLMANEVVVLDERSRKLLQEAIPQRPIHQLPNGVDVQWVDSLRKSISPKIAQNLVPKIVFVGWVIPEKGVYELVTACTLIREIDFQLDLVGPVDSEVKRQLIKIAAGKDNADWLNFTGALSRDEVIRTILRSDLFVLPSYTEGFPNALLEAMACGRAAIASTVGAIPEMLASQNSKEYGVCVPPRNVAALRQELEALLRDENRRDVMGRNVRCRAGEKFDLDELALRYVELWRGQPRM